MKKYIALLVIVSLFACKEAKKEVVSVSENTETSSKTEVKLYTFDGGTVVVNTLGLFAQDESYKGQSKEFADAFYVIKHPKGNLMWDAGLPESLVGLPEPYTSPDGAFTVSRKDSVLNQLEQIGMTPDDFKYISLSHTHFDHSGHANLFKNSTWLVQKEEYDFVTGKEVRESNPDMYNAIKDLKKIKKIKGDFDVFKDGTVILKYMPGHTPGHQVLFLDLKEHGPMLLSGDLYHFYENREYKRIPIFNYDVAQTRESMKKFEAFAEEKKAKVYLQHQKDDFNNMPKAPQYLN
ncbi:N-acyl homoserine lactonase family protein [uncultured Eudoraea sp.]|uniref:N-acyl homoserine lactonase family protein n=1 Tax=uncultured Eudoraea sp. TaxID=1035614 RepID=UPI0026037CB6|nr:N-acyl homoserine lactonase family protein [uncultured Eudoraea sp.]